jgi:predicted AAA+ superfamily ATPase
MARNKHAYLPRIADAAVAHKLQGLGGLIIEGPKWCGKTSTAERFSVSAVYMDDRDSGANNIQLATLNPKVLLAGETPRLVDEWQLAPEIFDAIRREIDRRSKSGQYILTGSTTPPLEKINHSGTGRFARIRMYPMSLFESGESSGIISLQSLFDGTPNLSQASALTVNDLTIALARGGWPQTLSLPDSIACDIAFEYLHSLEQSDLLGNSDKTGRRNSDKMRMFLLSIARNTATTAALRTLIRDVKERGGFLSDVTAENYMEDLKSLFVIEDQPAWTGKLRSKTPLRQTPKRHFIDPSIAVAAMGATPERLAQDLNTFGYLFESLCVRDIRIYAGERSTISHYRDKSGLEVDIVVEKKDGSWGAFEVKLGSKQEEEAAANLTFFSSQIDTKIMGYPSFLAILTAGKYAYRRKDGIYVIPIGCLGP